MKRCECGRPIEEVSGVHVTEIPGGGFYATGAGGSSGAEKFMVREDPTSPEPACKGLYDAARQALEQEAKPATQADIERLEEKIGSLDDWNAELW